MYMSLSLGAIYSSRLRVITSATLAVGFIHVVSPIYDRNFGMGWRIRISGWYAVEKAATALERKEGDNDASKEGREHVAMQVNFQRTVLAKYPTLGMYNFYRSFRNQCGAIHKPHAQREVRSAEARDMPVMKMMNGILHREVLLARTLIRLKEVKDVSSYFLNDIKRYYTFGELERNFRSLLSG